MDDISVFRNDFFVKLKNRPYFVIKFLYNGRDGAFDNTSIYFSNYQTLSNAIYIVESVKRN